MANENNRGNGGNVPASTATAEPASVDDAGNTSIKVAEGEKVEVTPCPPGNSAVGMEGFESQAEKIHGVGSADGAPVGEDRRTPPIQGASIQNDEKTTGSKGNRPGLSRSALPPRARPPVTAACKDHGASTPNVGGAQLKMRSHDCGGQGGEDPSKRADGRKSEVKNAVGAGGGCGGDGAAAPAGDTRTGGGAGVESGAGSAPDAPYRPRMKSMSGLEGNSEKYRAMRSWSPPTQRGLEKRASADGYVYKGRFRIRDVSFSESSPPSIASEYSTRSAPAAGEGVFPPGNDAPARPAGIIATAVDKSILALNTDGRSDASEYSLCGAVSEISENGISGTPDGGGRVKEARCQRRQARGPARLRTRSDEGGRNGEGTLHVRDSTLSLGETSETSGGCESEQGKMLLLDGVGKLSPAATARTRRNRNRTEALSPTRSASFCSPQGRSGLGTSSSSNAPNRSSSHLLKAIYHQNTRLLDQVATLETLAENGPNWQQPTKGNSSSSSINNRDEAVSLGEPNQTQAPKGAPSTGKRRGSDGGSTLSAARGSRERRTDPEGTEEPTSKPPPDSVISVPEAVAAVAAAARRGSAEAAADAAAAAVAAAKAVQAAVRAAGSGEETVEREAEAKGAGGEDRAGIGVEGGIGEGALLCVERLGSLAAEMNVEMEKVKKTATNIDCETRALKERIQLLTDKLGDAEQEISSLKAQVEVERVNNKTLTTANRRLQWHQHQLQLQKQQQEPHLEHNRPRLQHQHQQHQQQQQKQQKQQQQQQYQQQQQHPTLQVQHKHQQAPSPLSPKKTLPLQRSYPSSLGAANNYVLSPRLAEQKAGWPVLKANVPTIPVPHKQHAQAHHVSVSAQQGSSHAAGKLGTQNDQHQGPSALLQAVMGAVKVQGGSELPARAPVVVGGQSVGQTNEGGASDGGGALPQEIDILHAQGSAEQRVRGKSQGQPQQQFSESLTSQVPLLQRPPRGDSIYAQPQQHKLQQQPATTGGSSVACGVGPQWPPQQERHFFANNIHQPQQQHSQGALSPGTMASFSPTHYWSTTFTDDEGGLSDVPSSPVGNLGSLGKSRSAPFPLPTDNLLATAITSGNGNTSAFTLLGAIPEAGRASAPMVGISGDTATRPSTTGGGAIAGREGTTEGGTTIMPVANTPLRRQSLHSPRYSSSARTISQILPGGQIMRTRSGSTPHLL